MIYHPLEEFEQKFQAAHLQHTDDFFEALVQRSGVDIEENRKTVQQYHQYMENLKALKRKLFWQRVLRVVLCITLILIPVVIWKLTPKIRALREEIEQADQKAQEMLALSWKQMAPLNRLFTDRDALEIIEKTVPELLFAPYFTAKQEQEMCINYDFSGLQDPQSSTLDLLSGEYNENPFLFENKHTHTMGVETYHGSKTIHWTETYRDSNGKLQRRTRSETLHASVTKPKPFYSTQVVLHYGSQGAPELHFSRDATHLEKKSERELERYIKKGEKRLKRKTDEAIEENDDFVAMSNSDFEVLFDALDRTDEVQFRTLFTPLAQTNMVDLICSPTGYGDDFNFIKTKRMNKIVSNHSQGRAINLKSKDYESYDFDVIKRNFTDKNIEFFKAVYFDFAPLWAIPAYQERPVHSLKPVPDHTRQYAQKECEALANLVNEARVVHPKTKTKAILNTAYSGTENKADVIAITAYSYDSIPRVEAVSVYGGDGFYHDVDVHWDEYIPLENTTTFFVADRSAAPSGGVAASRNSLCIFQKD